MKLSYRLLISLVLLVHLSVSAQQSGDKFTLNGYIKDANNGETLIGATLLIRELSIGATSNEYGFYAVDVVPGTYTIEYSYLGYDSKVENVTIDGITTIDIELGEASTSIEEVVITAKPEDCLLYTSPSPRDRTRSRMPSSA